MTTLPDEIKHALYRFLDGRTSLAEFERWVYATPAPTAYAVHTNNEDAV
jgi:hypothetical protein